MKSKSLTAFSIRKLVSKNPLLKLFIILLFILGVLSLFAGDDVTRDISLGDRAMISFNLGNGQRTFQGETTEGMTVLDALNLTTTTGNINFKYSVTKNGKIQVMAIDGHIIDDFSSKFIVFLNSRPIDVTEINKIAIKAGDAVEVGIKKSH